jgi:hypothetical protein
MGSLRSAFQVLGRTVISLTGHKHHFLKCKYFPLFLCFEEEVPRRLPFTCHWPDLGHAHTPTLVIGKGNKMTMWVLTNQGSHSASHGEGVTLQTAWGFHQQGRRGLRPPQGC